MSSRVLHLEEVLPRVGELNQGEKIELLEFSLGSLYLATSAGRILQYGLAEWRDEHGRRQFSANHLATKELSSGHRIALLKAAPAINRLLAFCDSTLFILNLSDLSLLPMAGSNKLKGLSAVCINSQAGEGGPYSLEICVAKRKQGQLALLSLSEDKLSVVRTRDCPHTVLSMCLAGPHLCCAHPHSYTVYQMALGTTVDLFPVAESEQVLGEGSNRSPPPLLPTGPEEFLLLGPGNLGVFVRAGGEAGRPPVQWSSAPSHLLLVGGYLVALGLEGLSVHGLEDQELRQGISFPGGRWAGLCDGTLLLCTGSSVACLSELPWEEQAQAQLEAGELTKAVALAEGKGSEGNAVLCRAAFLYIQAEEWVPAKELLLQGDCDPREVVSLVPDLLPSNCKFIRSSSTPPLHSFASLPASPDCLNFLLTYLRAALPSSPHRKDLSVCLARLVAATTDEQLPSCLETEARDADFADLAAGWRVKGHIHFACLAQTHLPGGREAAVAVWAALVRGDQVDSTFPGVEFFVSQLSKCSSATVFSHCDLVLAKAPHLVTTLLANLGDGEQETALKVLSSHPEARLAFLRHLVEEKGSQEEHHHTQLALALVGMLSGEAREERRKALSSLVLTSHSLNSQFLLQQLKDTDLFYEQAILEGKLGNHERALQLLVEKAGDCAQAEKYCEDMAAGVKEERARLLTFLLRRYLLPVPDPNLQDALTVRAVELLNSRADELESRAVVDLLPDQWNIAVILPALRRISRSLVHEQRMTRVTKHLRRGENVQLRAQLAHITKDPVLVLPASYCVLCSKPFTKGGIARYPNGVMLHADCVKDERVCPLTGQVFTVGK